MNMQTCVCETYRQTESEEEEEEEEEDAAAAALVTPHLDHLFVHGALRVDISALCPSCHHRHWSIKQTHVGAYPNRPTPFLHPPPPLLPRQTEAGERRDSQAATTRCDSSDGTGRAGQRSPPNA